jgi:hypothetical protein
MINTKSIRALADDVEEEWDNEIVPKTLRQCADEIDAQAAIIAELEARLGVVYGEGDNLSRCENERDTLRAALLDRDATVMAYGENITRLIEERDTLRELVLEILDESTLKPDWFERAEKALNNADLPG